MNVNKQNREIMFSLILFLITDQYILIIKTKLCERKKTSQKKKTNLACKGSEWSQKYLVPCLQDGKVRTVCLVLLHNAVIVCLTQRPEIQTPAPVPVNELFSINSESPMKQCEDRRKKTLTAAGSQSHKLSGRTGPEFTSRSDLRLCFCQLKLQAVSERK